MTILTRAQELKKRMLARRKTNFRRPLDIIKLRGKVIQKKEDSETHSSRYPKITNSVVQVAKKLKKKGIGTERNPFKVLIYGGGSKATEEAPYMGASRRSSFWRKMEGGPSEEEIRQSKKDRKKWLRKNRGFNPRSYQDIEILSGLYGEGINTKIVVTDASENITKLHKWKDKQEYLTGSSKNFPIQRIVYKSGESVKPAMKQQDFVVAVNIQQHIPQELKRKGHFFKEINSSLKPGGRLIIFDEQWSHGTEGIEKFLKMGYKVDTINFKRKKDQDPFLLVKPKDDAEAMRNRKKSKSYGGAYYKIR